MFENALKPYSIVWDQIEENRLDTVNRMRPWSQGPLVKKPHSQPQQGNQREMTPLSITKERLREFKKRTQNDSKRELQKQEQSETQSPKPEVIKPFNESLETLKANLSMKKEGSYDLNSCNRTWKRTHWSAWLQSWDYNRLTEKQRDTIRKCLMNTTENTREKPDTTTEYWRLGGCLDGGEESIIITSEQI